ncbi:MAG TPA: ATP-dependent protease ATPase subunit HslU [Candidatus Kapabacteria bacterium]|nr:ATP-dependent protease ATPase subunit HslU [Candidatus Kapabacteria bacterium]
MGKNNNKEKTQKKNTHLNQSLENRNNYLTPHQIVEELNKYIIGQDEAKHSVAIALRNRWRRQKVEGAMRQEIMPNNIILIGPTGVGKTEIARRLASLAQAPFVKVEATKFTEVGYVGRDVDSMIRELVDKSVQMVKDEQQQIKEEQAQKLAEERLLDILIPPTRPKSQTSFYSTIEESDDNSQTREKFRELLKEGKLDEQIIEIDVMVDQSASMQVLGPLGLDELGMNIQDIMSNMVPKRSKKRKVKISEALKIFEKEEVEKLIDMDSVISEALERAQNNGIVFIDEIDKVVSFGDRSGGPDVSREGVQRDLLPIVEGSSVTTKYGTISTDHILFIASGAFSVSKPSDLIPELQGRFPIRVELQSLTEEDFVKILTLPENALIKQYQALLSSEGVELEFTEDAIKEIASTSALINNEVANIGARRLHTIMTSLLDEIMFDIPEFINDKKITIDAEFVKNKLANITKNMDYSKFIL